MRITIRADSPVYPYSIRDVHISDPFILADAKSGRYYTYVQFIDRSRFPDAAVDEPCFYVLSSEDLINWSAPKVCFRKGDFWGSFDYWAPEVHLYKDRYYLISSFRAPGCYRRCQCLVSDSPEGPFAPWGEPLTPAGWQCLDGTLYIDRKGKPWLVFVHEWLQVYDGQINAVELSEDLTHAVGDPMILFRATDAPWAGSSAQRGGGAVTDGPFLYRTKTGVLLMLWSSFVEGGAYAIGYARSASGEIQGPWIQVENPLYALDGGHGMLFTSFGGELMMAVHCPNDHMKKRILLFEMEDQGESLVITNEVTGNWYNAMGGGAERYRYTAPIAEDFVFRKDPRKGKKS